MMTYALIVLVIIVIAACLTYGVYRLLSGTSWFFAWFRGTSGLALTVVIVLLICVAVDVYTYRPFMPEKAVAEIQFKQIQQQRYVATLTVIGSRSKEYELLGDQWRLNARVIQWHPTLSRLGAKSGYRLDRLSSHYLSLKDEHSKSRSTFAVYESAVIDTWLWLKTWELMANVVNTYYGSGVFLPMLHDGHYQIVLTVNGLIARPLNELSQQAIEEWQ